MPYNNSSMLSITDKFKWIEDRNEEYSELYTSPSEVIERERYLAEHPTAILAFKCMDGRVHIPVITKMPLGIIQPIRGLGGKFDLGWPYLGNFFKNWVMSNISNKKDCLILVTYHFSAGDPHRGCAGFEYDTKAAYAYTQDFKKQIERVFGKVHKSIYPLIVGLETDSDALIFHNNGDSINLLDMINKSKDEIETAFRVLYNDMSPQILFDLMPMVFGNIDHIKEVKLSNRQVIDIQHKEWIIGFGSGFDWLHAPNTALIVGPWSPWMYNDLEKAFSIVENNMREGRISNDGFILLVSSMYREMVEKSLITEKVQFLTKFASDIVASDIIKEKFPGLAGKMHCLPVLVDGSTKKLTKIDI